MPPWLDGRPVHLMYKKFVGHTKTLEMFCIILKTFFFIKSLEVGHDHVTNILVIYVYFARTLLFPFLHPNDLEQTVKVIVTL